MRTVVCDAAPGVGDVAGVERGHAPASRASPASSGAAGLIAPGTDWPVRIAAYVAEDLGLPHPLDAATAVPRTEQDRAAARRWPRPACRQPAWSLEAPPAYPAVVKAPDRQGQRAMTVVATDAEQAGRGGAGAQRARAADACCSSSSSPGPEVTVNGFSVDGRYQPVAVTAREHFAGAPGVAQRHVYPSGLDDEAAAAAAAAAVAALGIRQGPSYVQLILSPDGPRIMEVAARLGGGHDSEICRRGAGVDLAEAAVRAALGRPVDEAALVPHPRAPA